jgi:hypothetical protein
MKDRNPETSSADLLKVLTAHYNSLVSARSDESLVREYAALLRFLRSTHGKAIIGKKQRTGSSAQRPPNVTAEQLRTASLDDIERLVINVETPRKDLEFIAIERFSVPRGSMRSFSNRQMLVDKLRTLIANERTHQTITAVAHGGARQSTE